MLRQTSVRVAGILLAAASLTDASATLARRQAPADDAPSVWQYRGCWSDVWNNRTLSVMASAGFHVTNGNCQALCTQLGYSLAGTEYAGQCFCGDQLNSRTSQIPAESCNMACTGDASQICGGPNALGLYWNGTGSPFQQPGSATSATSSTTDATSTVTLPSSTPSDASTSDPLPSLTTPTSLTSDTSSLTPSSDPLTTSVSSTVVVDGTSTSATSIPSTTSELSTIVVDSTTSSPVEVPSTTSTTSTSSSGVDGVAPTTTSTSSVPSSSIDSAIQTTMSLSSTPASSVDGAVPTTTSTVSTSSSSIDSTVQTTTSTTSTPSSSADSAAPTTTPISSSTTTSTTPSPTVVTTNLPLNFSYQGCYVDSAVTRILPVQQPDSNSLTVEGCINTCSALGYSLAGVEYQVQCYCGTSILNGGYLATSAYARRSCKMPCSGDATEGCGGRLLMAVYSNGGLLS